MKRLLLLPLLAGLAACGPAAPTDPLPFEPAGPDAAPDPSTFGPFQVGVRTVTYYDTGRRKPDGSPRVLVTEIWYPAEQSVKGQEGVSYDIKTVFTPEQQAKLAGVESPILHTIAVRDAPIAKTHGPYPLIVFSHGHGGVRWQSTYYTVVLASHGYVVISPDHEGDTLSDLLRDQLANTAAGVEDRPLDVRYLLNRMERLKEDDPLYGMLDLTRIGVTGHSFGALTSLRIAVMDDRVKAIVPQAPVATDLAWIGMPDAQLTIPVMIQAAHDDKTLPWDDNVAPSWPTLHQPRWLLDITHGGHFTFSDLCEFDLGTLADQINFSAPGVDVHKVLNDGCGPAAPPASVAQPMIDHFGVGFFNSYLRGSEGTKAMLTQEAADAIGADTAVLTADP